MASSPCGFAAVWARASPDQKVGAERQIAKVSKILRSMDKQSPGGESVVLRYVTENTDDRESDRNGPGSNNVAIMQNL